MPMNEPTDNDRQQTIESALEIYSSIRQCMDANQSMKQVRSAQAQ
jgi:hypothetical protein